MNLTSQIKAGAFRLGFCFAGVCLPTPPEDYPVFERWLEQGNHAGMAYLAAERSRLLRAAPRGLMPEVQSILVLAAPCPPPLESSLPGDSLVAAYARYEDYHAWLPARMEELAWHIQKLAANPLRWRAFTDSAPILERSLAVQAGAGWIGKNSNLILPGKGSFVLLAELFLDLPLEPDAPFPADRCGSCRRCLDACPTGCILPDRTIDTRRCISYLTIENREEIPANLRPLVGAWLFGCDVCQSVCPWNHRFAGQLESPHPAYLYESIPSLLESLELDEQGFKTRFAGSSFLRTRRQGLARNAAVVLGNRRLAEDVPALACTLQNDPSSLVRAHAAWALGQISSLESSQALLSALLCETSSQVLLEIQQALK